MPAITELTPAQKRAALARAERRAQRTSDPGDRLTVEHLRSEYAVDKISDYVKRTVDAAPPLTHEQRDRLALLLRGPSGGASA